MIHLFILFIKIKYFISLNLPLFFGKWLYSNNKIKLFISIFVNYGLCKHCNKKKVYVLRYCLNCLFVINSSAFHRRDGIVVRHRLTLRNPLFSPIGHIKQNLVIIIFGIFSLSNIFDAFAGQLGKVEVMVSICPSHGLLFSFALKVDIFVKL